MCSSYVMKIQHEKLGSSKNLLRIVLLVLWFGRIHPKTSEHGESLHTKLLYDVLSALKLGTAFFEQDYSTVNLDGLFGIRICEGCVMESLKDCSLPGFRCPPELKSELKELTEKINNIAENAMPYVQQQDPVYYLKFLQTIDAPYRIQYIPERLGDYTDIQALDADYDETKGDECYAEMFGMSSDGDSVKQKCSITDYCWNYMTKDGTAGYVTTHQLLYWILAEKAGCKDKLEQRVGRSNHTDSIRDQERHLCRQIYSQTKNEAKDFKVGILQQDLFLEQCLLCGILGFQEFVSSDWISMVLSWQSRTGCFTMSSQLMGIEEALIDTVDRQRQLEDMLQDEAKMIDAAEPGWMGRRLMREQVMDGDCLAHKSGLGYGTLGVYLRHLIQKVYGQVTM